jgi:hypothetical protein
MYAVIKTGGKQYRVANGLKIKVEQIPADVGSEITLDQVLMVGEGESVRSARPSSRAPRQSHRGVPRSPRQGPDLQDAPSQALPEASGPSSELHRTAHRRDRGLKFRR